MKKKVLAVFLAAVLLFGILPVSTFTVQGVTLSGPYSPDPATYIVNIASAQVGKTKTQLGYSGNWCAAFVSDCAAAAGQSKAVPWNAGVSNLKSALINAGATQVSTPRAGDIAILNGGGHCGICVDSTYVIDGNNVSNPDTYVQKSKYSWFSNNTFYRPNYSGHTHSYSATRTVSPTCTAQGYTVYTCSCGDSYKGNYTTALGHDYSSVVTAPTCTMQGYTTHTCARCGDTYKDAYNDAHGHNFTSQTIINSTCTEDGVEIRYCANCDAFETRVIPAHHSGQIIQTVAPTCTEDGYDIMKCSVCGTRWFDNKVEASGHHYEFSETVAPNCGGPGYDIYICTDCKDITKTNYREAADVWVTEDELPENADLSKYITKVQYRKSDKQTEQSYNTPPEGYTLESSEWVKSGTGTHYYASLPKGVTDGTSAYNQYNVSAISSEEKPTTKRTVDPESVYAYIYWHWCRGQHVSEFLTHNRTIWEYKCENSYGNFNTFHSFISTVDAPYNFDIRNNTYHEFNAYSLANQSVCDDTWQWNRTPIYQQTYTDYKKLFTYYKWSDFSDWQDEEITPTDNIQVETRTLYCCIYNHEYGDWVAEKEVSCTEDGIEIRYCANCDAFETRVIPAHHTEQIIQSVAATCTAGGYDLVKCTECGVRYKINETPALEHHHIFDHTVDPTCEEKGYDVYKCERCDDCYYDNYKDAIGHDYHQTRTVAATCVKDGYYIYTCDHCTGTSHTAIPALGHYFVNGYCVDCGVSEADAPFELSGDGRVDANDLTVLKEALLGDKISALFDVNGDGETDVRDLVRMKKHFAK